MRHHNSLLHDLLTFVPWAKFDALVDKHGNDRGVRTLTSKAQFIALLQAQLCGSDSLRGITTSLSSFRSRLYHLGIRSAPARSTLADANAKRPAALYSDLFAAMLPMLSRGEKKRFGEAVHLLDATTLRLNALCRAWAPAKSRDGAAIKLHVTFDLDAGVPVHFDLTQERVNDVTVARAMTPVTGTTYVLDLGYYSFNLWRTFQDRDCRFVTRLKRHTRPRVVAERAVCGGGTVLADREIRIDNRLKGQRDNPLRDVALREVEVKLETGKVLRLVTNDMQAPAEVISALYKARWQIELFFKWIKQNLKIDRFLGTSENAVRIQIAIAMIAFLLLRIAHANQSAVPRLLDFKRLVALHMMRRCTIHTLTQPPPTRTIPGQQILQLC